MHCLTPLEKEILFCFSLTSKLILIGMCNLLTHAHIPQAVSGNAVLGSGKDQILVAGGRHWFPHL